MEKKKSQQSQTYCCNAQYHIISIYAFAMTTVSDLGLVL